MMTSSSGSEERAARHASAWHASRWRSDRSWIHVLDAAQCSDLRRAVTEACARGVDPACEGDESFPLPRLGPVLRELLSELEGGRGFVLLRGVPLEGYDVNEIRVLNAGIAAHLGRVISQNSRGDRVGEVCDRGARYGERGVRGHASSEAIAPHCDSADLVSLLCVQAAARGGESSIASATAIFDTLRDREPELLPVLRRGFRINLAGKGPTGDPLELSRRRIPVFSVYRGLVSCRFNEKQIRDAADILGVPLEPLESYAVRRVGELAIDDAFRFDMTFRRGDVQILNNHCVLHSRRAFEDDDTARRLLLRTWMNMYHGRPLAEDFADRLNTGPRGEVAVVGR